MQAFFDAVQNAFQNNPNGPAKTLVLTVLFCVMTIISLRLAFSSQKKERKLKVPETLIGAIFNWVGIWGVPTIAAGVAIASGVTVAKSFLYIDQYVPLNANSVDSSIKVEAEKYVIVSDPTHISIPLRLSSSKQTKLFYVAGDSFFSISTEDGNVCHIQSISGLQSFYMSDFGSQSDSMKVIGPDSALPADLTASCDQPIASNTRFILAFEFFSLPVDVVQNSPGSRNFAAINVSGDQFPIQLSSAASIQPSEPKAATTSEYVPVTSTSSGDSVRVLMSKYIQAADTTHVNIPLRILADTPTKVFAILNDQTMSLSTKSGTKCHFRDLKGLHTFYQSDFAANTDLMQVVSPIAPQPSNPMATCDRNLAKNDVFVFSIQLNLLPVDVVQNSPAASAARSVSFSADDVMMQQ
jgi:hypothetical protein